MGTLIESTKFGIGAAAGYRLVDYFAGATQDERLRSRDRMEELSYRKQHDAEIGLKASRQFEQDLAAKSYENYKQREFAEQQGSAERRNQREIQSEINATNERIAELDNEARKYMADQAREAAEFAARANTEIAHADFRLRERHHREQMAIEDELVTRQINAKKAIAEQSRATAEQAIRARADIADADFRLRERHHQQQIAIENELVTRQINTQKAIAEQSHELERYLTEQRINSDKEIAKFKTLAARETQILVARENAANILQDRFAQDALSYFPLNISPIVLLRNRPHSFSRLLAFSGLSSTNVDITDVYEEVTNYAMSPEALSVFIAPVHVDSKIRNREQLSKQIWDSVYQDLESFFNANYNRNSTTPVILYPTAWKNETESGTHACETLYFFLRDMPCFVLEPRFNGQRFCIGVSAWGLGYESDEHARSDIEFDINIDAILAEAAYSRSKKSLCILEKIDCSGDVRMTEIKNQLLQNVTYFESLDFETSDDNDLDSLNALGVYRLFNIEPMQDLAAVSDSITRLITIVLAVLTDIHHLKSTDAEVRFPKIFKDSFPELFEDKQFRERVFRWYESVYIRLRNKESRYLSELQQKENKKIREAQIRNVAYTLELIDEEAFGSELDHTMIDYAKEKYGFVSDDIDEVWWKCIDNMSVEDIPFFEELKDRLSRGDKRRRRIVNRIADLR